MTLLSAGSLLVEEPLLVRWMGLEGAALALIGSDTVGIVWDLATLVTGRATVGWILQAVLMGLRFLQGRWRLKRVV